ncbi:hypothetical protein FNV43_RR18693 [Rhamnella rubrinervis]|uniref:Reverse transcriptase zinc-binding domain-containing protein n=1 Tax=Rhamnella rubrinervis TaxID=2594499 RepID=A0A8K0GVW4_9ROSA|nr:hypothetical protein FNV43_RR18693 [Rhamnella rubrinervis]
MASKCRICGKDSETISHLLLTCLYAAVIWDCLGIAFGLNLHAFDSMGSLFQKTMAVSLSSQFRVVGYMPRAPRIIRGLIPRQWVVEGYLDGAVLVRVGRMRWLFKSLIGVLLESVLEISDGTNMVESD